MKAADADTLGGKPASAYPTSDSQVTAPVSALAMTPASAGVTRLTNPSGTGTTDYIPLWTNSTTLGNSLLFQSGITIGIGTTTPASPLTLSMLGNTSPQGVLIWRTLLDLVRGTVLERAITEPWILKLPRQVPTASPDSPALPEITTTL